MQLDSVVIGASDVAETIGAYALLLGIDTTMPAAGGGQRLQLARGAVEIVPGELGLLAVGFLADEGFTPPPSFHGIDVRLRTTPAPPAPAAAPDGAEAIGHVVVQSTDPERAIALWQGRLGLRLALDRTFPERGVRLLFFRTGGITLEYASPLDAPTAAEDRLYGVSYRVCDLAVRRARLVAAGLDVSEIRPGARPGTRVATVRSGTAGVATLLLEVLGG